MKVLLVSTYDLGHQPFALASAAAWLRAAGAEVACNDLAVEPLDEAAAASAGMIAVHLPMHTATRLAAAAAPGLRARNPRAHLCFFGLYAPLNAPYLRAIGGDSVIGGEFEGALAALYRRIAGGEAAPAGDRAQIVLDKLSFRTPARDGLPALDRYGTVDLGAGDVRLIGYTEASRGCKHLCRHCPVVPVYGGRFRVVQADVVLADVARLVAGGARHITFGDPDFFNGVGHARRIVGALHRAHPDVTYDVTIKIEHLLRHRDALPELARTGCVCITTAVESVDDGVLEILDKGHGRADFRAAVEAVRAVGIALAPTFIPFTPWTGRAGYLELLREIDALGLVASVAPVQLAMRLLVPRGSRLLEHAAMRRRLGAYDEATLSYGWDYAEPGVAALHDAVRRAVEDAEAAGAGRAETFGRLWRIAHDARGTDAPPLAPARDGHGAPAPRFSEPWYCCAEPTGRQFARV